MKCMAATYQDTRLDTFVYSDCFKGWPWAKFFDDPKVKEAIKGVADELEKEAQNSNIEPPLKDVFKALEKVGPNDIKVVIVGQDPTPQEGKATGMAFSVAKPRTVPSVMNVLMEVALEGWSVNLDNGDLSKWAKQGVLLLNSALTIGRKSVQEEGKIKIKLVDHLEHWSEFTSLLITNVAQRSVWILWGNEAQNFALPHIPKIQHHYIITGAHPSPKNPSIGNFFGRNYFFCANKFLEKEFGHHGQIDWGLAVEKDTRFEVKSTGLSACPEF